MLNNLRPRVVITADAETVTVKGKIGDRKYQYATFQAPDPNPGTSPPDSPRGLIGFSTCECGALYANLCLACESGFAAR